MSASHVCYLHLLLVLLSLWNIAGFECGLVCPKAGLEPEECGLRRYQELLFLYNSPRLVELLNSVKDGLLSGF